MSIWTFRYNDYDPDSEKLRETLCTVGNGYFATRGAAPESSANNLHYPGTYVAGCYNRLASRIDGREIENESLVNAPNWLPVSFRIGKERNWFDLDDPSIRILDYVQELGMRSGVMLRNVSFEDSEGRVTRLNQKRFVHMEFPHLAGLETTLVADNWSGRVKFLSALNGRVNNSGVKLYRRFKKNHLVRESEEKFEEGVMGLTVRTSESRIRIAEVSNTKVKRGRKLQNVPRRNIAKPRFVGEELELTLRKGEPVTVEKLVALYTSRDYAISEPLAAARRAVASAPSFAELLERQKLSWDHLWRRFKIEVEGDDRAALALHLHNFHLLQAASPNSINLDVSAPARGLHGEGYRGHIFWDELFVIPLFNLHVPDLTRSLLMYRYRRLGEAERLALKNGFRGGALYPWESASDGSEQTPALQLNPVSNEFVRVNTPLQYHVDAAIAYNIWSYYQVTHDLDFLTFSGSEMFLEIARFFGKLARLNESTGRYEIHGVMGPDEYHDSYPGSRELGLNNNAYTNLMAVWTLEKALEIIDLIPRDRREILSEDMDLRSGEIERWREICRSMFVPFHDGVISQFEGYENLKEFDWEGYRKKYGDVQKLDTILRARGDSPNNYKVSKQADVIMLFYLFSYGELRDLLSNLGYRLSTEDVRRNIKYYSERTSHGSTLSRVVHAWVFARMNRERSWQIAKEALESDLSDIQGGTTAEGIHLGAMAGTVDIIQRCYMGLVTRDGVLWLAPHLPEEIKKLSYTIYYGGHTFDINASQDSFQIFSHMGKAPPVKVGFHGEVFEISPGGSKGFHLRNTRSQGLKNKIA